MPGTNSPNLTTCSTRRHTHAHTRTTSLSKRFGKSAFSSLWSFILPMSLKGKLCEGGIWVLGDKLLFSNGIKDCGHLQWNGWATAGFHNNQSCLWHFWIDCEDLLWQTALTSSVTLTSTYFSRLDMDSTSCHQEKTWKSSSVLGQLCKPEKSENR